MFLKDYIETIIRFVELYGFIFIINIVFSLVIVFIEKRKPISTLLWVMTINFLPILGFLLYLILGQDLSRKRMFDKKGKAFKKMNQIAKVQLSMIKSGKISLKEKTKRYVEIIEMFNHGEDEILYRNNEIVKFNNGKDMFESLFKDMRAAKNSIYLESYIFKSDNLGKKVMDLLVQKAKEGLEVILLVDGMGARGFKPGDRKKLIANGVKVEIFFPGIFKTINTRINFRNHRKIVVIDHKIGYVGGLNIGDEYVSENKKFGFWRDTHLRIAGDAVRGLQFRFFLDYRYASDRYDGGFISLLPEYLYREGADKEICIVTSGPDTKVNSIRNGYEKIITRAKKNIYIQTPYFVPDEGLLNALKVASLSGCQVNIMIPRKRDHFFVHWASLSFIGELLQWGAKAYFYEEGFLHTKVICCDDYISSVGTANFDIRSFELNFEVNAFVFDAKLNRQLVEDFNRDVKKSTELTLSDYENRNIIIKVKEGISRLLSPVL
ncbi:cardiolipin synthase [Peptoniphilus sp. oral taxon 386]|uniref:cardiolipin synthase n=1 Tax=Peptoniphilus sp. oral taxon 386 TaxID=652713 RepID=UPI0001DA9DE6|nr:cardiolipin synthase [Peptoniphilus sp. oral taxon 386]EFI41449.1 putative cardiolipin synthetase [Peptoniphilus sp. oral taxon 386 str. F0131]